MEVWIVIRGEAGNGGTVIAVRRTQASAERIALAQSTEGSGSDKWVQQEEGYWTCGCDWVSIELHTVHE